VIVNTDNDRYPIGVLRPFVLEISSGSRTEILKSGDFVVDYMAVR
jgi:hypothetical protein